MIHQIRPVRYFHHQVTDIAAEQITAHPCALCLPVQPYAQRTVMNIIMMYLRIDRRVELDSRDLIPVELMLRGNLIDLVAINITEYTTQMPHNTVLAAIMDHVVAHDMRANVIFVPALQKRPAYRFKLIGITRFPSGSGEKVIARLLIFTKGNGTALGVMDMIILYDPSFGPVRPDQPRDRKSVV